MKKAILKTTMLAAIASLTMSGYALAHHPLYTMDEELYYEIDERISDQHNEVIGDVTDEDFELMANLGQSMDANEDPTAAAGDAVASQDASQSQMSGVTPASNVTMSGMSGSGGVSAAQTGRQ